MNRKAHFFWCKNHRVSLASDLEYYVHVANHTECHVTPISPDDPRIRRREVGHKKKPSIIELAMLEYKKATQTSKPPARRRTYYSRS